jgi:hypothetical protein
MGANLFLVADVQGQGRQNHGFPKGFINRSVPLMTYVSGVSERDECCFEQVEKLEWPEPQANPLYRNSSTSIIIANSMNTPITKDFWV